MWLGMHQYVCFGGLHVWCQPLFLHKALARNSGVVVVGMHISPRPGHGEMAATLQLFTGYLVGHIPLYYFSIWVISPGLTEYLEGSRLLI